MSGTKTPKAKVAYDPRDIAARALRSYEVEAKADPKSVASGLSPAGATRRIAETTGLPASRLAAPVARVYFRENGTRNPLPLSAKPTPAKIRAAVRKRRDGGTTLARWETVASALASALGRPVSEAAVRAYYEAGGGDLDASYVGRGTRASAPKTREDETAEVSTVTK